MKLSVISFTNQGGQICRLLTKRFRELGEDCRGYVQDRFFNPCHEQPGLAPLQVSLGEWTGKQFEDRDGLIFVGAAGIAVRAVAPYLKGKDQDPAVVVVDEQGRFSISLLSGHLGGANDLAARAAEIVGAMPVVTTATDLRGKFAVDVFARDHSLAISDLKIAKQISADILEEKKVGFYSDFPVAGNLPAGLVQGEPCERSIWVTIKSHPESDSFVNLFQPDESAILRLIPRRVCLGIGCRKGTEKEKIRGAVHTCFELYNLDIRSVGCIASIDLKKDEAGLIAFASELEVPFQTFSPEKLLAIPGEFTASEFVKKTTGVENVCERAAVAAAGGNPAALVVKKYAADGVTVAAAVKAFDKVLPERREK